MPYVTHYKQFSALWWAPRFLIDCGPTSKPPQNLAPSTDVAAELSVLLKQPCVTRSGASRTDISYIGQHPKFILYTCSTYGSHYMTLVHFFTGHQKQRSWPRSSVYQIGYLHSRSKWQYSYPRQPRLKQKTFSVIFSNVIKYCAIVRTKYDVLAIEPSSGNGCDEELRAVGVGTSVGHGQLTRLGMLQFEILI